MSALTARALLAGLAMAMLNGEWSSAAPFVAFSLREAERRAQSRSPTTDELKYLGGITRVCAIVYDEGSQDVILVGAVLQGEPKAELADLAVALRARLRLDEWPTVSIDPTADTPRTRLQKVSFWGGLEDTTFGDDFLKSDIVLKEYSLERQQPLDGVPSFRALFAEALEERLRTEGTEITSARWLTDEEYGRASKSLTGRPVRDEHGYQCRFWFYPRDPTLFQARDGVFCIKELQLTVEAEITQGGQVVSARTRRPGDADRAAVAFSQQFADHLRAVSARYPVLKRLKILYDLVAVAQGIRVLDAWQPAYLLNDYPVRAVATKRRHDFVELYGLFERSDGKQHVVHLCGGLRLTTDVRWLNYGQVGRLKKVVLEERPAPNALSWRLPLDGWKFPNRQDLESARDAGVAATEAGSPGGRAPACSLFLQSALLEPHGTARAEGQNLFRGFDQVKPFSDHFTPGAPAMKCNGVFINPRPLADPEQLHPDEGKRIRDRRPDRKSPTWKIERPNVELEDE